MERVLRREEEQLHHAESQLKLAVKTRKEHGGPAARSPKKPSSKGCKGGKGGADGGDLSGVIVHEEQRGDRHAQLCSQGRHGGRLAQRGRDAVRSDGTVIPQDLGLHWALAKKKEDYLGK